MLGPMTDLELLTRDGCTLAYRHRRASEPPAEGAETVVLLHGWSQSQATFDRLVPLLPPHLDVVTYDMRNHGVSGRTDRGARVSTLAADLRELLDHLGLDRAHLLGHSMGCSVIWSLVDLHGLDRIASLVLVDQPSVVALSPWIDPAEGPQVGAILDFQGVEGFVSGVMGPDQETVRGDFLRQMLTPDITTDDFAWLHRENLLLPMPWGARLLQDHALQDWRDVLPHLTVPTLVIGGEVSHVDAGSQRWIAGQIPDAEVVVLDRANGGAHFAFVEAPAHTAAVLGGFWSRVTGVSPTAC